MKTLKIFFIFGILVFTFLGFAQDEKDFSPDQPDNSGGGGIYGGRTGLVRGGMGQGDDQGLGMGQVQGGPFGQPRGAQGILGFLDDNSCPFSPSIDSSERQLLSNSRQALNAIRNSCSSRVRDIDEYGRAVTMYNAATGGSNIPSPSGFSLNLTCFDYEAPLNTAQRQFMESFSNPEALTEATQSMFRGCMGLETDEAARSCAQRVTSDSITRMRSTCQNTTSAQRRVARSTLVQDTFGQGIEIFRSIAADQNCMGDNPQLRQQTLMSGMGLAAQAATATFGPLAGMAASFLTEGLTALFRGPDPEQKNQRLDAYTNLACLHNKLERKAQRCDQLDAANRMIAMTQDRQSSDGIVSQVCADPSLSPFVNANRFIEDLGKVVRNVTRSAATSAAPVVPVGGGQPTVIAEDEYVDDLTGDGDSAERPDDFNQDRLDVIVDNLSSTFPGSNQTLLQVGGASVTSLKNRLDGILSAPEGVTRDTAVRDYLRQNWSELRNVVWSGQNGAAPPDQFPASGVVPPSVLRKAGSEILRLRDQSNNMKTIFEKIQAASTSTRTPDQERDVLNAMAGFRGDFTTAFDRAIRMGAQDQGLAAQVSAYNSQLQNYTGARSFLRAYERMDERSRAPLRDQGRFQALYEQTNTHLQRLAGRVLDEYVADGRSLLSSPGSNPETETTNRNSYYDNVLAPILMACNQLKSVIENPSRVNSGGFRSRFSVCEKFVCSPNGNSSFPQFAAAQQPALNISSCTSAGCADYKNYICQETRPNRYREREQQVRNDFMNSGRICGRSPSEIFR